MALMKSFYKTVPKSLSENVTYRLKLLEQAESNPTFQQDLRAMCRRDLLFWINA